ncbi:phosphoglycerate mutase [Hyaloscypha variabilis]
MAVTTHQIRAQDHRQQRRTAFCGINTLIPILFVITIIAPFLFMMGQSPDSKTTHLQYSTVTGYFEQDEPDTDPRGYDFASHNFGLIERKYYTDAVFDPHHEKSQWQRFYFHVDELNAHAAPGVQFKVLYLGRHGEGFHNVAEALYGTKAWDCYWAAQDGNGNITWSDALLTLKGISQAQYANAFWRTLVTDHGIPLPQTYYSSPLLRCLATAYYTFSGLPHTPESPFIPTIKELLRESIGVHTCDRRSSKSTIHELYPEWPFEEGFAENDPLWVPDLQETNAAMVVRARSAMDDIFSADGKTHISISSHSGMIASLLEFLGHRKFRLETGQAIPVLVKAERVNGELPPSGETPWKKIDLCTEPPAPLLPN